MINNPLVSVIIPTYKRSDYLLRAIDSVLRQTYAPIEIIVVDDNEGNNEFREATKKNLQHYITSAAIQYLEHENNKGLPAARNTGIRLAKGDYVAFLDDDDEFLPEKIGLQVACFQRNNPSVGLVYGSFMLILFIFPVSIFLGYLRNRDNNLFYPIVAHFTYNFFVILYPLIK